MTDKPSTKPKSGWLSVAVDYGPLLVFFLTYRWFSPDGEDTAAEILAVVKSTGAFIAASVIALGVSKFVLGKVSPMLLLSTVLIVGFGALTIYFQDELFVMLKPTLIYLVFAAILLVGYCRRKSLLKMLLETAFEGLTDDGWLKLSRNWGFFFIFLGALNSAIVVLVQSEVLQFATWIAMKLWLFMPLTFVFTFTQVPMLMKHGLAVGEKEEVVEETPPPG